MINPDFKEFFPSFEGECQGCDTFGEVNDLSLCDKCASKLDRDLIREGDWDYSALAFGVPTERREDLRKEIISKYDKQLELIAPKKEKKSKNRKGNKSKDRHRNIHQQMGHTIWTK
ncbi:MAG: hypothetical protein IIA61_13565 [Candidatus Marinimicrobia bacterium]|nr:hypothetical protein [Candidatus Neomarinimicrobiota bacterium]